MRGNLAGDASDTSSLGKRRVSLVMSTMEIGDWEGAGKKSLLFFDGRGGGEPSD